MLYRFGKYGFHVGRLLLLQTTAGVPAAITTPDKVETRIGTLEFKDGAPTVETAEKVRDALDFTRALDAYNNSFRGASAYAIRKGFQSIGAEDNTVVIFSELMDAKSLFLTANADTVYYIGSRESDARARWWSSSRRRGWARSTTCGSAGSSTSGSPAPIAAKAASTCSCRPATTARCPRAASIVARSKTNRVLYAARSFLDEQRSQADRRADQEDTSRSIRTRRAASARASRRRSKAMSGSARTRPFPKPSSSRASGKSFNTIPPSDYGFFEMINENVQQEPATSYDVELAGQLAAIGIVKGKPFEPDARMKKILTDAAAVGNAAGRVLNWRYAVAHPEWSYYPGSMWGNMLWEGGANFETPPPEFTKEGMFKPLPPTGARTLDSRTAFYYGYTLDSPGMIMRIPDVGSQYLMGFLDSRRQSLRRRQDLQGHAAQGHSRAGVLVVHALRQPVALDARHAAALPARRQPELSVARRRSRTPTAPRRSTSARSNPTASSAATGSRPCPARAGSRSCASTARSSRSSRKSGGRARSNWSSDPKEHASNLADGRCSQFTAESFLKSQSASVAFD